MIKKIAFTLVVVLLSSLLLSSCATAEDGADAGTSTIYMIVFLVLLAGIFYLFIIRPQSKRQKEQRDLNASLRTGDRVITIGGIYGRIESIREDSVILKVESGATIRVVRSSIAGKQEETS
ncbi:MAG: preprotein translocase subunit YajC [Dehalococcoidia bacterium]|nr:MAG: preprotein translocase subunit YajC [Dehalococcoidia bacterium]